MQNNAGFCRPFQACRTRLTSMVSGLSLLVWGLLCGQAMLLAVVQTVNHEAVCHVDHGFLCDVYMGVPSHEKRGKSMDSSPPRRALATAERVAPDTFLKILKTA
ncbi:hypothetical protein ACS5NO_02600 [Larkinella sp. GY13]|uniref:hypothetical protein n=1 Tax=Larkinella sp. GY13 TaxID=3453720 RepID=UPI003EEBB496